MPKPRAIRYRVSPDCTLWVFPGVSTSTSITLPPVTVRVIVWRGGEADACWLATRITLEFGCAAAPGPGRGGSIGRASTGAVGRACGGGSSPDVAGAAEAAGSAGVWIGKLGFGVSS